MESRCFGGRAFGYNASRVDSACTGEGGGDVFSCLEDVFVEDAVEGWEEVFVATENHADSRGGVGLGFADGVDDCVEDCSEAGKGGG